MEEEKLPITFSEPLKDTPFGEVFENFQEPVPFEVPLPFEEIPVEEPPSLPYFVQKQASYGLLDNKYLIRY